MRFRDYPGLLRCAGLIMAVSVLVGLGAGATSARAAVPAPVWRVRSFAAPTSFETAQAVPCNAVRVCNQFYAFVTNVGSVATPGAAEPVSVTMTLTPGVEVVAAKLKSGPAAGGGVEEVNCGVTPEVTGSMTGSTISCVWEASVRLGGVMGIEVKLIVPNGMAGSVSATTTVQGGGAAQARSSTATAPIGQPSPSLAAARFGFEALDAEGAADERAGDHPPLVLSEVAVPSVNNVERSTSITQPLEPVEGIRHIQIGLPLGFLGNPQATPQCPLSALVEHQFGTRCQADTQVGGFVFVGLGGLGMNELPGSGGLLGIYNLVPEKGYAAEFGFNYNDQPIILYANVVWNEQEEAYRLQVVSSSVPRLASLVWLMAEFFGNPAAWKGGEATAEQLEFNEVTVPIGEAFVTNPVDCSASTKELEASLNLSSWENPQTVVSDGAQPYAGIGGCEALRFNPSLDVTPESRQADAPSGYATTIHVPEPLSQAPIRATPELKTVTVTLPAGVELSPTAAHGLSGCSASGPQGIDIGAEYADEIGISHLEAGHCPSSSKIGTATIKTPLLAGPLTGSVFLASPGCGGAGQTACTTADAEDGNLFGLYLEVEGSGVNLKLVGKTSVNTQTGQITTTFANNPQFPASEISLDLNGGPDAVLSNPQGCGVVTATSDLAPWSSPFTLDATPTSSFDIEGCSGGFSPSLQAGTVNPLAGAYSPFTLTLKREDREQDIASLSTVLPEGLLAAVSHVAQCPEPQAFSLQGGCPMASKVGTTTVSVGSGSDPYYVAGQVYFTGPYDGAPFGLSVLVPAVAGPFNLGNVTVRVALFINSSTGQVTAVSGPLPQMIDGVPLRIRTLSVTLNASSFTFNPTRCSGLKISGTVASTQGAQAAVSSPFAAAGCNNLPFKPGFSASTAGKASKAGGASLTVKVTSKGGPQAGEEANIRSVKVDLPKQLPSRLTTLQKACLAATFEANPATCDKASVVGTATAVTPILAHPLVGPAYLVSHGGQAFPDLEIVLQAEGVRLVLDGNTDIKKGITSSTFKAVPDAPISSFELKLPMGAFSVLGANVSAKAKYNLCGQSLSMPTAITGQNGAVVKQATKITINGCAKTKTLTRAQKLAKALKVCGKKARDDRATCRAKAHKQFAPAKKKKSK